MEKLHAHRGTSDSYCDSREAEDILKRGDESRQEGEFTVFLAREGESLNPGNDNEPVNETHI